MCSMNCVHINISRTNSANVTAQRNDNMQLCSSLRSINISANKKNVATLIANNRGGVIFTANPICTFSNGAVLVVTPNTVWLNEGNNFSADFDVISNVDWIIE